MAMMVCLEDDTTGEVRRLVVLMRAAENGQVALTEHNETVAVLIDPGVLASLLDTIDLFAEGRRGPNGGGGRRNRIGGVDRPTAPS